MYSNQSDNSYNNQACDRYRNQVDNTRSNQADTIYSNQADIYRGHAVNIHNNQTGNHYSNQSNIQLNNGQHSKQPLLQQSAHTRVTSYGHNSSKSVLPGPGLLSSRSDQDISRGGLSRPSRPLETFQDREQAPQGNKRKLSGAGQKRLRRLLAEGKLSYEEAFEACLKHRSASSVERPNVPKASKNNLYENQGGKCDEESPYKRQRRFEEDSHCGNQGRRCDKESPDKHQRGRFEEDSRHGNQRGRNDEESSYRHERGRFEEESRPDNQRGKCDEESPYRREMGRFEQESHPENQRDRCVEESPYMHQRARFEENFYHENWRGICGEESLYRHERGRFEEESHPDNQIDRCDEESPYMHKRGRFEEDCQENQRGRCDEESHYRHDRGRFEKKSDYENQRDRDEESHYKHQRGRFEEESLYNNQTEATRITPMGYANPPPSNGNAARGYPRVGIRNYEPMTPEQMTLVNATISSTISRIGRSVGTKGSGPKFHGVQHKSGWLLITCEDRESQEWLINEVPRCKPWPEARLSVMEERELPSSMPGPWTAATFIPLTEAGSAEEAMDLIRYQNKGLYLEHWKIICERVNNKNHIFAIFSLDEHSAETLLHGDCRVYIGMKKILLKLRSNSKVSSKRSNISAGGESRIQGLRRLEKDLGASGSSGLECGPTERSTSSMDHTEPKPGGLGGEVTAAAGPTETGEKIKRKRKRTRRKERGTGSYQ